MAVLGPMPMVHGQTISLSDPTSTETITPLPTSLTESTPDPTSSTDPASTNETLALLVNATGASNDTAANFTIDPWTAETQSADSGPTEAPQAAPNICEELGVDCENLPDPCSLFPAEEGECTPSTDPCDYLPDLTASAQAAGDCLPSTDPCDTYGGLPGTCGNELPDTGPLLQQLVNTVENAVGTVCGLADDCNPSTDICDYYSGAPGTCGNELPDTDPILQAIVDALNDGVGTVCGLAQDCNPSTNVCDYYGGTPGTCGNEPPDVSPILQLLINTVMNAIGTVCGLAEDCNPSTDPCTYYAGAPGTCGNDLPDPNPLIQQILTLVNQEIDAICGLAQDCNPSTNICDYFDTAPGTCGNPLPSTEPCDYIPSGDQCPPSTNVCDYFDGAPGTCGNDPPDPNPLIQQLLTLVQQEIDAICSLAQDCNPSTEPCDYVPELFPSAEAATDCLPPTDACFYYDELDGTCGNPPPDPTPLLQELMVIVQQQVDQICAQAQNCDPSLDPCFYVDSAPGTCENPPPDPCSGAGAQLCDIANACIGRYLNGSPQSETEATGDGCPIPESPCDVYSIPGYCKPVPEPCQAAGITAECDAITSCTSRYADGAEAATTEATEDGCPVPEDPCQVYSVPGYCEPLPDPCSGAGAQPCEIINACAGRYVDGTESSMSETEATEDGCPVPEDPCEVSSIPGYCEPIPEPCQAAGITAECDAIASCVNRYLDGSESMATEAVGEGCPVPEDPCMVYSIPGYCEPIPNPCDGVGAELCATLNACLGRYVDGGAESMSTAATEDGCPVPEDPCQIFPGEIFDGDGSGDGSDPIGCPPDPDQTVDYVCQAASDAVPWDGGVQTEAVGEECVPPPPTDPCWYYQFLDDGGGETPFTCPPDPEQIVDYACDQASPLSPIGLPGVCQEIPPGGPCHYVPPDAAPYGCPPDPELVRQAVENAINDLVSGVMENATEILGAAWQTAGCQGDPTVAGDAQACIDSKTGGILGMVVSALCPDMGAGDLQLCLDAVVQQTVNDALATICPAPYIGIGSACVDPNPCGLLPGGCVPPAISVCTDTACIPAVPLCPVGTCDPTSPPRPAPPLPNITPPARDVPELGLFGNQTPSADHDWDGDGLPNYYDAVNLPSEARVRVSADDSLSLVDGLGPSGFALLIEPRHQEALLVLSLSGPNPTTPLSVNGTITASQALDLIQLSHGTRTRNVFAMVLHDQMRINLTLVPPNVPANLTLHWSNNDVPADGTWILARADPTRRVQFNLPGRTELTLDASTSHFSTVPDFDYRWEFINPYVGDSFCFDAASDLASVSCQGTHGRQGWLRSYSGQASYATAALQSGFEAGLLPLHTDPVQSATDLVNATADATTNPTSLVPASAYDATWDIFDAASPVHLLGNKSYALPPGVGTDYLVMDNGRPAPLVTALAQSDPANVSNLQRRFAFQGSVIDLPVVGRDMIHLEFLVEPVDGNHSAQTLVFNGAVLSRLINVSLADGETFVASIDDSHTEGFSYTVHDVDGDGLADLVVTIPHFGPAWLSIDNGNYRSAEFWDVEMSSPTTGWVSGGMGYVYRYESGQLTPYRVCHSGNCITTSQRTLGLHVVSDTEFFVVGASNCYGSTHKTPFIAHYDNVALQQNGFVSLFEMPSPSFDCDDLHDVWLNSAQDLGYAGGSEGLWVKYTTSTGWQSQIRPTFCGIMALAFDSGGSGYAGVAKGQLSGGSCMSGGKPDSAIMQLSGSTLVAASDSSVEMVYGLESPYGNWAAGFMPRQGGPGIYHKDGSTWRQTTTGPPALHMFGVANRPGTYEHWFGGRDERNVGGAALLMYDEYYQYWTRYYVPVNRQLQDLTFADSKTGLAVGWGVILQYSYNRPPSASMSASPGTGTTMTTFTASASASDPDSGDVLTTWWDWGDGYGGQGTSSSHRYNDLGTWTVTFAAEDNYGDSTYRTQTVRVDPVALGVGTSPTYSYAGTAPWQRHHFVLPSSGTDRWLEVSTNQGATLPIQGQLSSSVWGYGTWPPQGPETGKVVGKVPAGVPLYIAIDHPADSTTTSYAVTIRNVVAPDAPQLGTIPNTVNGAAVEQFQATAPHPTEGRPTALLVDWGDGTSSTVPAQGFLPPTENRRFGHTYTTTGQKTLFLRTIDDIGHASAATSVTINVHLPPGATIQAASQVDYTTATLNGQVSSLGGASSVQAWFVLMKNGQTVQTTTQQTISSTGTVSASALSLQDAATYTYKFVVSNDVGTRETSSTTFITRSGAPAPSVTNVAATVALGQIVAFDVQPGESTPFQVAYWVAWGDGTETRYPGTGFQDATTVQRVTHKYGFAAAYPAQFRIEASSGTRSAPTNRTATTTGASPIAELVTQNRLDDVVFQLKVGAIAYASGTEARIAYQSPASPTWQFTSWGSATSGNTYSYASGTLTRGVVHHARAEFRANGGTWEAPTSAYLPFQTNQRPTLTPLEPNARQVAYGAPIKFAVIYMDVDGDPPVDGGGSVTTPIITIDGTPHPMTKAFGECDCRAGVTYYYEVPSLSNGTVHRATFTASDQYQAAASAQAGTVTVQWSHVLFEGFEKSTDGKIPIGFSSSTEQNNYWRAVDTNAADVPDRVQAGSHGTAVWFAHPTRGNYQDPSGGIPRGTLTSDVLDLRVIDKPVLSFLSFYETEDMSTSKDVKLVRVVDAQTGTVLQTKQVSGQSGGYGAWKVQALDLAASQGRLVRIQFTFDAIDNQHNQYLGWLIDDVVVGHDEDDDNLADELERQRPDAIIFTQPSPAAIPELGSGKANVRRVSRSLAEELLLDAIVQHAAPDKIRIWLGVEATSASAAQRIILYQPDGNGVGQDQGRCRMPGFYWWGFNFGLPRTVVQKRSDGVDLKIDLLHCGFTFDALRKNPDWYLEVEDLAADGKTGSIDRLRTLSTGHTLFTEPDTDNDGYSDFAEIKGATDPLGTDADGDTVAEQIDPDPRTPQWMPALRFGSDNPLDHLDITYFDNVVTVASLTFWAERADGTYDRGLPATYVGGTTWRLATNGYRPEVIAIQWKDVYGNVGTLRATMGPNGDCGYCIDDARLDTFTTQGAAAQVYIPCNETCQQGMNWLVIAGAVVVGTVAAPEVVIGVALVAVFVVVSSELGEEDSNVQQTATQAINNNCLGPIQVPSAISRSGGVQMSEVYAAATSCDYAYVGVTRIFYDDGLGNLIIVVIQNGKAFEAWKLRLPSAESWGESQVYGQVMWLERKAIENDVAFDYEYAYCHRYCRPDRGDETVPIDLYDGGTNMTAFLLEADWRIPIEYKLVLDTRYRILEKMGRLANQSIPEYVIGNMALAFTRGQAFTDQLNARQDVPFDEDLSWYWDNSATNRNDCPNPDDTRACVEFQPDVRLGATLWKTIGSRNDYLNTYNVKWRETPTSSVRWTDGVTTKGRVYDGQKADLETGKDVVNGFLAEIDTLLGSDVRPGVDAEVRTSYDWVMGAGGAMAKMYFMQPNSPAVC